MCYSKEHISRWNVVVELDSKQFIINTHKSYKGASIDTL